MGTTLSGTVQQMSRTLALTEEAKRTDAELLRRFIAERHELSFAALVRRHGPMVFAVCRRMLQQHADAEDAMQAVFIVLMRRAKDVRPAELGRWLHGVAVRVCVKARTVTQRCQWLPLEMEPFAKTTTDNELSRILDEELSALPSKYRSAIIECDVLERSRSDAAQILGWPEGTVATRLAKARQLLADKLRQRGVTLSVTALSLGFGSRTSAMPKEWDVPTASALHLAEGVLRTMSYSTLIWRSVAVLLMLGVGGSAMMLAPAGDPPGEAKKSDTPLSVKAEPKMVSMVWKEREPIELKGWLAGSLSFSADGTKLLVGGTEGTHAMFDAKTGKVLLKPERGDEFAAVAFAQSGDTYAVTAENMVTIYTPTPESPKQKKTTRFRFDDITPYCVEMMPPILNKDGLTPANFHQLIIGSAWQYNVKSWYYMDNPNGEGMTTLTTGKTKDKIVDEYAVPLAVDPNGERIVCTGPMDPTTNYNVVWAWSAGSGAGNKLMEGHTKDVVCAAWSKDGSTIVTGDAEGTVIVWDAKTSKETKRFQFGKDRIGSVDVSANGKRIATATIHNDKPNYTENVYVWDVANPPKAMKPIAPPKGSGGPFQGVASIEFTPDGKTLAACFCNFDHLNKLSFLTGEVRIWDLKPKQ